MGISARALLRKNTEPYELWGWQKTGSAITRPVVVMPLGTRLCRPSEAVLEILPDQQQEAFTKEDGKKVIDEHGNRISH